MDAPTPELLEEQRALRPRVRLEDDFDGPRLLGGFDVAYQEDVAVGALVLLDATTLEPRDVRHARVRVDVPYIPGFLGHREFPVLERLWRDAPAHPDILVVDGAGVMHPRRMGTATYAGLRLDTPTIGVAKSLLYGRPDRKLEAPGDAAPVRARDGELLGYAYWSSPRATRPIFVSAGHRVSQETALRVVRDACRLRIPEPTRIADAEAARAKRLWRSEAQGTGGPPRPPASLK